MAKSITYVDANDKPIGAGSIENAHANGIIHRVSRIFLFNGKGELLLQKRAAHMHSSPGKWCESAAGHVDEGETYLHAAEREMMEEIGVRGIELHEVIKTYTEDTEETKPKRFNMIYRGIYEGEVHPNAEEVAQVRWVDPKQVSIEIGESPHTFTQGFRDAFKEVWNKRLSTH